LNQISKNLKVFAPNRQMRNIETFASDLCIDNPKLYTYGYRYMSTQIVIAGFGGDTTDEPSSTLYCLAHLPAQA
jgi:hypothetical protein